MNTPNAFKSAIADLTGEIVKEIHKVQVSIVKWMAAMYIAQLVAILAMLHYVR
jgi:hypothetical protein